MAAQCADAYGDEVGYIFGIAAVARKEIKYTQTVFSAKETTALPLAQGKKRPLRAKETHCASEPPGMGRIPGNFAFAASNKASSVPDRTG